VTARPDGHELRAAALAYASRGIPVLPLHYPVASLTAARPVPAGREAALRPGARRRRALARRTA
jgi:hypothetical protein